LEGPSSWVLSIHLGKHTLIEQLIVVALFL
jgi:hypothetical protein